MVHDFFTHSDMSVEVIYPDVWLCFATPPSKDVEHYVYPSKRKKILRVFNGNKNRCYLLFRLCLWLVIVSGFNINYPHDEILRN